MKLVPDLLSYVSHLVSSPVGRRRAFHQLRELFLDPDQDEEGGREGERQKGVQASRVRACVCCSFEAAS